MTEDERTELRIAITNTAASLFGARVTQAMLRQTEEGVFASELWAEMVDLGLTSASLPEEQGGIGTLADALSLMRPAGYSGLPLPLGETLVAGWLAAAVGMEVPNGVIVPAIGEIEFDPAAGTARGLVRNVPWGRDAVALVMLVQLSEQSHVAMLPCASALVTRGHNVAGEARDQLLFEDVALPSGSVLPAAVTPQHLHEILAAMRAAQMAGAIERVLELTVQYAQDRVQFGKPIGKFQAIQHQIAVLANSVAASVMAAERALNSIEGSEAGKLAAMAKVRVGEAAGEGARIAHQVHGAIGFTHEHVLHYFTRRLWAWRDEGGSEAHWARQLGAAAMAGGADALWAFVGEAR